MKVHDKLFTESVIQAFRLDLGKQHIPVDCIEMLHFLIDQNVISQKEIRKRAIKEEFKNYRRNGIGRNKSHVVKLLARQYQVHENTIWNLISDLDVPKLRSKI